MKYDIERGFIISVENDLPFRLMLIVVFYIGLAVITKGIMTVNQARDSMTWLTTHGVIATSRVVDESYEDGSNYSPEVTYRYSVKGREYTSSRIFFGPHTFTRYSFAKRYADSYPKGTVLVYYDPADPQEAVLLPGAFIRTYSLLIAGSLLMIVPILIYVNLGGNANQRD